MHAPFHEGMSGYCKRLMLSWGMFRSYDSGIFRVGPMAP